MAMMRTPVSHDRMLRIHHEDGVLHLTENHYLWKDGEENVTAEAINGWMFELTCFEPMHPFDILRAKRIKVIAFDDEGKVLAIRKQKKIDII